MDVSDASNWVMIPLQVLFVDLLLGADNALVIALACRRLPPQDVRRAAFIGVLGAIALRLALTMVATGLMAIPLVKGLGGLALALIAMNILEGDALGDDEPPSGAGANLWAAAGVIIVADATMGLDNVVALAAISRGDFLVLLIGVALSLPILAYGGILLTETLKRAPALVEGGAALLGWIAGGMILSDPLISGWADANAPGLVALAPGLGAAFVFLYGRFALGGMKRAPVEVRAPLSAPPPLPVPPLLRVPLAPYALAPLADAAPEPDDRSEPPAAPASREDRIAIIGVLLLAVAAGAILMIASFFDSFN